MIGNYIIGKRDRLLCIVSENHIILFLVSELKVLVIKH